MNGSDWVQFAREQAQGRRRHPAFGEPGVAVARECPSCGRNERWVRTAICGDTPGHTELDQDGRLVAVPARRGFVVMFCWFCRAEVRYGGNPLSEAEQVQTNAQLYQQAKTGKVPL